MFPTVSKATAKAAQLTHQVFTAAKNVPTVVSHMVTGAENIIHPNQSWAANNPNADFIKQVEDRVHSDLGSVADHAMCSRSTQDILLGKSGYGDAATLMKNVPKNEWHPYKAGDVIPAGTAVWYPSSNPHGHVAVSMGGGKVYTTDAFGNKSGIVDVDKVFGDRSPIGWSDYVGGKELGTDQGQAIIGLDNRSDIRPASRSSAETGASRQESFTRSMSDIGADYATAPSAIGATPAQASKKGVLGLDVDTSS